MKSKNPLTKPLVDKDGNILPDDGPPLYVVAELDGGDEEFIMATNITSMAHSSAEGFALEMGDECESCRIIDGETHQALFRYEAGKGLQEGWSENDPALARLRSEHISSETYTPFPGKRFIRRNSESQ